MMLLVVVVGGALLVCRCGVLSFLSLLCRCQPLQASCIYHALLRASEMRRDVVTDRYPPRPLAAVSRDSITLNSLRR
jgi:hypothetical protein